MPWPKADARHGPNVVNVHQANFYSPYINYPYSDDSFPAFCDLVKRAHAKGVKLRVYYTTREITQNMPELFPLHSFNGEIILPGPGKDARTLLHPKGPHAWLAENLREDFIPAWEAQVGAPYADLDLSVITTPDSRWNNFYLEGLRWLVEKSDFDGMYIDDTALDATSLRRARRILDSRPGRLIDLHTWNHFNDWAGFANNLTIYMEILPYLDRLWLGEGFNASAVSPGLLAGRDVRPALRPDERNARRRQSLARHGLRRNRPAGLVRRPARACGRSGTNSASKAPSSCRSSLRIARSRPDQHERARHRLSQAGPRFIALGSWAAEETTVN